MAHIAFFANYIGLGGRNGAYLSALDTLMALLATPHRVTSISQMMPPIPQQLAGYRLNRPNFIKIPPPFPDQLNWTLPHQSAAWLLGRSDARSLKALKPDLLLVNGLNSQLTLNTMPYFGLPSAKQSALIVHNTPSVHYLKDADWAVSIATRYDHLIFVSPQAQQNWLVLDTLAGKRSFVIPNCGPEERALALMSRPKAAVRRHLGLPVDDLIAVCVGSIEPRKGQDLLVQQFPLLLKYLPNLTLLLIGSTPGRWGQTLTDYVAHSPWAKRLCYLGSRPNALAYIYAADILLLPSRAEAQGRVLLEAALLKTAVIATAVGGITDVIKHQQTGLLFESDRPRMLVEAFAQLGSDAALRHNLAEQSNQRYWTHFSRSLQIQRYQAALRRMLA
ncbi:MAG: glycosyltransferase family 4 protein [Anaerolineae bacterium]|nr:glycosyltransferase family 4 protein [Anaerolineae bacterium]